MKIVALTDDPEEIMKLFKSLGVSMETSRALKVNPDNIEIFTEVASGIVEVDPVDNSQVRRVRNEVAKMADVVILGDVLGKDNHGRMWLTTSMAACLDVRGYKGLVCVRTGDQDVAKKMHASPAVHSVLKKSDTVSRIKVRREERREDRKRRPLCHLNFSLCVSLRLSVSVCLSLTHTHTHTHTLTHTHTRILTLTRMRVLSRSFCPFSPQSST